MSTLVFYSLSLKRQYGVPHVVNAAAGACGIIKCADAFGWPMGGQQFYNSTPWGRQCCLVLSKQTTRL